MDADSDVRTLEDLLEGGEQDGYNKIPYYTLLAVVQWINEGRGGGDFLRGVLSNNLMQTFHHADGENAATVPQLVKLLYNRAPQACWGSAERVEKWRELGGLVGMARAAKVAQG